MKDIEFELSKLISKNAESISYHQWPSEQSRWMELIFSLLTRIGVKPQSEIRQKVQELNHFGLLNPAELAEVPFQNDQPDPNHSVAKRIIGILQDNRVDEEGNTQSGFSEEESIKSLVIIHETAKSLLANHHGKIQKYLRSYGEKMVKDFSSHFKINGLTSEDQDYAVKLWLQNVLNMPLSLKDENMQHFCESKKIDFEELVHVCDEHDVNLATLDDMVQNTVI